MTTRIITSLSVLLLLFSLGACSRGSATSGSSAAVADGPAPSMVSELDAREALALANSWGTSEKRVTSFVDAAKISFQFADGRSASVELPEEKMVVAIAPYVERTHPCETHYMSGCQGELVGVPVRVFGKTADGLVVVDDTFTTMKNGFFELWIGRDLTIELTVEYDGKRAVQTIATLPTSNTCVTTMQLL